MYLNEEGMYHLPINIEATNMFKFDIYGNIAIVGKAQENN